MTSNEFVSQTASVIEHPSRRSADSDEISPIDARYPDIDLNRVEELLENIFTPTPVELLKVTLYKFYDLDDFGFSLSEGIYEKGVYVSGVKPDGPAAEGLQAFDKILQVFSFGF